MAYVVHYHGSLNLICEPPPYGWISGAIVKRSNAVVVHRSTTAQHERIN